MYSEIVKLLTVQPASVVRQGAAWLRALEREDTATHSRVVLVIKNP